MGYCSLTTEDNYAFELDNSLLNDFITNHKEILNLFEGDFLIKKNDKEYSIFYDDQEFVINSRDFPTLDDGLPNKKRAIARFFSDVHEEEGDCGFGLGQEGLPKDFYKDLFNLTVNDVGYGLEWGFTVESGEEGYHSGCITLTEKGLVHSFQYYENDDEEDEDLIESETDDWHWYDKKYQEESIKVAFILFVHTFFTEGDNSDMNKMKEVITDSLISACKEDEGLFKVSWEEGYKMFQDNNGWDSLFEKIKKIKHEISKSNKEFLLEAISKINSVNVGSNHDNKGKIITILKEKNT